MQADQSLDQALLVLPVFAVEARSEEGPFPLSAARADRLAALETHVRCRELDVDRLS